MQNCFKLMIVLLFLGISQGFSQWEETGKSGIPAIDSLPLHEWDVETQNNSLAMTLGMGLLLPGGAQYYTGHYVRAGFLTALEVYLLSEIFINYPLRQDTRRENARIFMDEATGWAEEMARNPYSPDYNDWQTELREAVESARENNDIVEENAGLLTSEIAWLFGLHLYGLMDGYGIWHNNVKGHSTKKREVSSAVWRAVLIPGWGQLYNEEYGKAGLLYMGLVGSWFSYFARQHTVEYYLNRYHVASAENRSSAREYTYEKLTYFRKKRNQYIWGGILFYLYSIADAAVDALMSDFDDPKQLAFVPRVEPLGTDGIQWVWNF